MTMGHVCCRGSCCPVTEPLSEAPATRHIAAITGTDKEPFVRCHLLWRPTIHEHTDATIYNAGVWL